MSSSIIGKKVKVASVGLDSFFNDLKNEGADAVKVDWKPPAGGAPAALKVLEDLECEEVDEANSKAISAILSAEPKFVGMAIAKEVIPELKGMSLSHSGPPIKWERMSGPMKGAIIGAAIYEGWIKDESEINELIKGEQIKFMADHDVSAVGPMAGVISPDMPVYIVQNATTGNKAYTNFNEGVGKVLRYGAYGKEVIDRLNWMKDTLYPMFKESVSKMGPLSLKPIMSQSLQMGDELHTRNVASTLLFIKEIAPYMTGGGFTSSQISQAISFMGGNNLFFLNLAMAAGKVTMDAASGINKSTIVTALTRNGTDFGIKVSGLGKEWFTAPAPVPKTLFFPGFKEGDANPDIGDSAIMETNGFGAFSSAASPAVTQVVGSSVSEAIRVTRRMYEITAARDKSFPIPALNFEGIPRGIDLRLVIETSISPTINTGVAHRLPGMGTVGFGIVDAPLGAFDKALQRFGQIV
ncbi:MAG: DUF1116 domain-containing protein [Thaumarchaeota archaeon]|jgi:hypothetical protein|nr:DUF1116 domain-containing protein [Nitrososphaerota archaeon]